MSRHLIAALALTAAVFPASGEQADPMSSPECKAAREALEQAVKDAAPGSPNAALGRARRQAANACLGPRRGEAARAGAPWPVQAVPPTVVSTVPTAGPLPTTTSPSAPLAIQRPIVITTCDPAGCWDSEGRRLNNVGPLLMGPGGLCTVQGGLANCP